MDRNPIYIAVNVKYYREKLGISQTELAEKLHIAQASVAKYELGKTRPETKNLIELANIFGVSVDELCSPIRKKGKK